jgi:hypothetical protein
LANPLAETTEEEFGLLFAELAQRTYTLYCFSRPDGGKAPAPAPADGPASTDAASPPPAAAPSGGKPQKRVLSFGRKPKKAAEPAVDMESEAAL